MEKISDILDNIKERLTNPLLFSFILSWIFVNWEISVALLWYDPEQLERVHHSSIFTFIQSKLNWYSCIFWPFVFALLYTFLMPIIKNIINMFYAWNTNWGNRRISRISGDTELNKMQAEYISLQKVKVELEQFQTKLGDFQIIAGKWSYSKGAESYNIEITSNNLYHLDKFDGKKESRYVIANLFFDSRYNRIFFVVCDQANNTSAAIIIYDLEFQGNAMIGTENTNQMVRFDRLKV